MRIKLVVVVVALAVAGVLAMQVMAQSGGQIAVREAPLAVSAQAFTPARAPLPAAALFSPSADVPALDPAGIERLIRDTNGAAQVSVSRSTGAVRFVRLAPDRAGELSRVLGATLEPQAQADAFFARYGSLFGLAEAGAEVKFYEAQTDRYGTTRLQYRQYYRGVPVFAGWLFAHFDAQQRLTAVNGVSVPNISTEAAPLLNAAQAAQRAIQTVGGSRDLSARKTTLYIYRTGLAKGVSGAAYLVYEVEVSNLATVREFVYVDARSGKIIDRVSGIHETLTRRVYSGTYDSKAIVWEEGDTFPFAGAFYTDVNKIILASGETYSMFLNAFGRDSYNALGAALETVNNDPRINCPNANWNGITTNYCNDVTGDDTVAHEWGHAYTEYTHNLIYQWQPGALNESYSDIWGEVVDMINNRGLDQPDLPRTNACSVFTPFAPVLTINSPAQFAGNYATGSAQFGPQVTMPITSNVVIADDGVGQPGPSPDGDTDTLADACQPLINGAAVSGKLVLVNRGICAFVDKVKNAQAAGAIGVIVANRADDGDIIITMAGSDPTILIPSVFVGYSTGEIIHNQGSGAVNATMKPDNPTGLVDNSLRWLSGEDDAAFGGAIRDMWNPNCYGHPGKVTDMQYTCSTSDGGGVHSNSGVPNHTYALIVDGGTYNGQTIASLGLTRTIAIYWRAQSVYQNPATDFADHADALEQACSDLIGQPLFDPITGLTSSATISVSDCQQVNKAVTATELRTPPTQCNFQPALNPVAPALCAPTAGAVVSVFSDTLEIAPTGWTVTHTDVYSATTLEWAWVNTLPDLRPGSGFYGVADGAGSCSTDVGDLSKVLRLTSPIITLPANTTVARLAFDHYFATEAAVDGGNLKISVNGGPWQLVQSGDFSFNPYNATLTTSTNPLAGQPAFTAADGGVVTGSWYRSMVLIGKYARPGNTVQLRFEIGSDGCGGIDGWYVDDVQVYYCATELPGTVALSSSAYSVNEGAGAAVITATVDTPYPLETRVDYAATGNTATAGSDFTAAAGTLIFAPNVTQTTFAVTVLDDTLLENTESISLALSNPVSLTIGAPATAALSITDNDQATVVYHDVEDVVGSGESIYLAGDFNGWNGEALPMTPNGDHSVFTATLPLSAGSHDYKFVVYTGTLPGAPANWNWLQSNNRTTVITTSAAVNHYRNIQPGYYALKSPTTAVALIGQPTVAIYGQIWGDDLTQRPGAARGLKAELGYGTAADPADWSTWQAMTWSGQVGNDDEYVSTLTVTATGVYSYAVRFTGNWGAGNPHNQWYYGDGNGNPFSIANAGVLTVKPYEIFLPVVLR